MGIPMVAIVMPTRKHESCAVAIESLMQQTFQDFELILVVDQEENQAEARNRGLELAHASQARCVLFSDNDIKWMPDALETMVRTLAVAEMFTETIPPKFPTPVSASAYDGEMLAFRPAYAYGTFCWTWQGVRVLELAGQRWSYARLRQANYIPTMALVDMGEVLLFDPTLRRLEDWDLWLRLAERGAGGVWCGKELFTTEIREGLSWENTDAGWRARSDEAWIKKVREKRGLGT